MSKSAVKRLARDLRELTREPIVGSNAAPLENNMLVWHCTTVGPQGTPYEKVPLHWILEFTENYPNEAPKAFFPIKFGHGRNFYASSTDGKGRQYICMNIFSNFESQHPEWQKKYGEGWSPSYTVSTILVQFQAALSDGEFISHSDSSVSSTLKAACKYTCKECNHNGESEKTWKPQLITWQEMERKRKEEDAKAKKEAQEKANAEAKAKDDDEMQKKKKLTLALKKKIKDEQSAKPSFEPICYATRQNLTDDKPILGYGLIVKKNYDGKISSISSPYEFLSLDAYKEGFRRTSMKAEFTDWIPVFINDEHWSRAKSEFESRLFKLMNAKNTKEDRHRVILEFFALIMGSMFENQQRKINEHFIEGYFSLHRTLLSYEAEFKDYANGEAQKLMESVPFQKQTPLYSIDYWMMIIFLSRFDWFDIAPALIHEIEVRNTNDYLVQHPELSRIDGDEPDKRASKIFRLYRNFLVKVAFYAAFYQNIRGLLFSQIDHNNSMLDNDVKQILLIVGNEVRMLGSWQDFYQWIGLTPAPDNKQKGQDLLNSMLFGEKMGYYQLVSTLPPKGKMYSSEDQPPVQNCPDRQNNYHRCSEICLAKYGTELEQKNEFALGAESDHEGTAERKDRKALQKKKRAWLRQSH